ncbi:hypothetical protein J5U23_01522 [Saccharolobus shibatae B12]|uniref:Uncharacterized protein n=1 Tax=Saccharolobus shibatae (strain ATCC 51178 / DSM 5389 / JCM 8931 / NBRC 15437 / B12) TaxID=523848 RepID=A0A8F5BNP5_SACSH|nr:hypothetical protein J5U23_01522 [Saccharolobus shibatae B12]
MQLCNLPNIIAVTEFFVEHCLKIKAKSLIVVYNLDI